MQMAVAEDKHGQAPTTSGRAPEFDIAIERAIERIRKRNPSDVALVHATPCFGEQYVDDTGVCPNDGVRGEMCALRNDCEATYKEATARILARQDAEKRNPEEVVAERRAEEHKEAQKKAKPKKVQKKDPKKTEPVVSDRGKWKDTEKYLRNGYVSQNRPVDRALIVLTQALGDPPTLPKIWSPINFFDKYGGLGRVILSQSANYTSVRKNDGYTLLRCWTNAAGCMIVDVAPELTQAVGTIPNVRLKPIPAGSEKKLRPCTHRFELAFGGTLHDEVLAAIGAMIRMAYRA